MSFCLRPNVCKKCGKPLTLFEGWTCLECEKAEQEPSVNDVLEQIRAEVEQIEINGHIRDVECFRAGINAVLNVIDKYIKEQTYAT